MSLYCKSRAATEISTLWEAARKISAWGEAVEKCGCRSCPEWTASTSARQVCGAKVACFSREARREMFHFSNFSNNEKH